MDKADNVSLSLDDIIKKQRKQKQTKVARVKGFRTKQSKPAGNFQGRVSRNFTFKSARARGRGNVTRPTSNNTIRGSGRYFSNPVPSNVSPTRGGTRGIRKFNPRSSRVNVKVRRPRMPLYQQPPNQHFTVAFPSYKRTLRQQPQFIPGRNQRGRRTWTQSTTHQNFISPERYVNRQRKFKFAKKRVQRARELLIASRIAQNLRTTGQRGRWNRMPRGTGRIAVGRFGLVTTRRANQDLHRNTIQQKILRAQMARQGISNSPMFRDQGQGQDIFVSGTPQNLRSTYSGRGRARGSRGNSVRRQMFDRQSDGRLEGWSHLGSPEPRSSGRQTQYRSQWDEPTPTRTIQNNNNSRRSINEVEINRGRRSGGRIRAPGTLDPDIQSHISFIQQQGRRVRGENQYDPLPTPTVSVCHSSMTLSDRFKSFMN